MQVASLFAGLGGFDVAAESLGHEVALQAEVEPAARRVLQAHWPGARLERDARSVDLRGIDLVTAGFPCQGLSQAAATRKHGGLFDEKSLSFVIWQVLDQIERAKPSYLLFENASALRTARYADDLRALLGRLAQMGYFPQVISLNSGCYGSHMRRVRTFMLCRRKAWSAPDVIGDVSWACDRLAVGVNNQQGGAGFCLQPSVTKKAGVYTLIVTEQSVRTLLPEAVETLFGLAPGWTRAAGSNNARYERLGNAVSVDAARAALQILLGEAPEKRAPSTAYADIERLSVDAPPGTSASAVGRIVRSLEKGRGNHNVVEVAYCLPTYLRIANAQREKLSSKMVGYLERLTRWGEISPKPWPGSVTVRMAQ